MEGAKKIKERMSRRRRRGRISGNLCILGLHLYSEFRRQPREQPTVTAGLIAANTLIYLRPGVLDDLLPSVEEVCLQPYWVVQVSCTTPIVSVYFRVLLINLTSTEQIKIWVLFYCGRSINVEANAKQCNTTL